MLHQTNRLAAMAGITSSLVLMACLAGCGESSSAALIKQGKEFHQKGEIYAARIALKNAVETDPVDAEARFTLATVYNDTGEALAAEKEVRRAIALGYKDASPLPVLGKALLLQGQFQKVLEETEAAVSANDPAVLCIRADAYLALNRNDDAKHLYSDVLHAHPGYPAALIGLGRVAFVVDGAEAAMSYADQALKAAPRSTDALLFKGDVLRAQQKHEQALTLYDQALKVNPLHRTAHVEKAYLEIAIGKFPAAQADLDAAREIAPNSLLVAYTQALLDFSQGKNSDARSGLLTVLNNAPEHMPSVLLAGAVDFTLGMLPQAERHLRTYLKVHPDNDYARKMLASILLRYGQSPDALTVLQPALKGSAEDVELLALAGESYMQASNFSKAAEFYEKASDLDPKAANLRTSLGLSKLGKGDTAQAINDMQLATRLDLKTPAAGMALVRAELGLQHFDKAFSAVTTLEKAQPGVAAVQDLKGLVYLGKQDSQRARAAFEHALVLQPSYYPAVANIAQLDMVEKKPASARKHLLEFLGKNSKSLEAMNALASLALNQDKPEEATTWLEKGQAAYPDAVEPAVRLIMQYLATGQKVKALSLARNVQVARPDEPNLLDLLGKAQLANGEVVGALETYKKMAAALPRAPEVHMQIAALQIMMNNTAAADDQLKTVLAMKPDFPAAQVAQAELYVRNSQYELAVLIARQLQRSYPGAAAGYQLEGDVLISQNRPALALPVYEQAYARKKSSELVVKTVNAMRRSGKQKEGEARLAQWLQQNPKDVRVQLYKAETMMAEKQFQQAAEQLDVVLKIDPANVSALNNQAWSYHMAKDPRALPVAEAAQKAAAENPTVLDTLGWILVEQGDAERGLPYLQRANARAPQALDVRYHMAVALFKTGNRAAARKELQQLVAPDVQFAQADEARALMKQLE